jgi:chlorite dismutase
MTSANPKIISFIGADRGPWKIASSSAVRGEGLSFATHLDIVRGPSNEPYPEGAWTLQAVISNLRYTTRDEKSKLDKDSRALGQPEFDAGAFIPIRKSAAWWALTQDERRKIFEEDSKHIATSAKYLSYISRQLHHSRDLGGEFDFLTWFEFSAGHVDQFDELCYALRKTKEWEFVEREVEVKLVRNA